MIRVLLADDQALIRAGFRSILDTAEGIDVIAEAIGGADAIRQTRTHRPDIVLMDIRMPGVDGLQATRTICDDPAANTRVIILTTYEADNFVYEALSAGASGFLVKDTEPADLFAAVRIVAAGEALLSPASPAASSPTSPPAPIDGRSPRPRWPHSPTAKVK